VILFFAKRGAKTDMNQTENLTSSSKDALRTSAFLDTIVKTVKISKTPTRQTAIPCLKDKGRNRCLGFVKIQRQDIPTLKVQWSCNECDEFGVISDIVKTPHELINICQSNASITSHPVLLTREEFSVLLYSDVYDPTCGRIILEAIPLKDGIQIILPDDDVEFFMETIAPLCNHEKNKSRAKLLDSIFGKCMDLYDSLLEKEEN
jgi:hypothetical protein